MGAVMVMTPAEAVHRLLKMAKGTKGGYTRLADGQLVRVMDTPFPISTPHYRPREGDQFVHDEWGNHYIAFRPVSLIRREFTARKGADGRLWLVQTGGPAWE